MDTAKIVIGEVDRNPVAMVFETAHYQAFRFFLPL
jgi:hypothetical protein